MENDLQGNMVTYHVVQFASEGGEKFTIVPLSQLNDDKTVCLSQLPIESPSVITQTEMPCFITPDFGVTADVSNMIVTPQNQAICGIQLNDPMHCNGLTEHSFKNENLIGAPKIFCVNEAVSSHELHTTEVITNELDSPKYPEMVCVKQEIIDEDEPNMYISKNELADTTVDKDVPIREEKSNRCSKASLRQMETLVSFIEENPNLCTGKLTQNFTKKCRRRKWETITKILNAVSFGSVKAPEKWRKCWNDHKSGIRIKAAQIKSGTTNGDSPESNETLSPLEERILNLLQKQATRTEEASITSTPANEVDSESEPNSLTDAAIIQQPLDNSVASSPKCDRPPDEEIVSPLPKRRKRNRHNLQEVKELNVQMLEEMQKQTAILERMASAMERLANVCEKSHV